MTLTLSSEGIPSSGDTTCFVNQIKRISNNTLFMSHISGYFLHNPLKDSVQKLF